MKGWVEGGLLSGVVFNEVSWSLLTTFITLRSTNITLFLFESCCAMSNQTPVELKLGQG